MLPNRSLSHTKQKRPHSWRIPTRGYILQQGKNGTLGIHWGSAEKDTSSSEGLISSVYAFPPPFTPPLSLHYFYLSIHLYLPVPLSVSLPVELWVLIWRSGLMFTVLWHLLHMIWQVSRHRNNRWLLFPGSPSSLFVCIGVFMCVRVLRALYLGIS